MSPLQVHVIHHLLEHRFIPGWPPEERESGSGIIISNEEPMHPDEHAQDQGVGESEVQHPELAHDEVIGCFSAGCEDGRRDKKPVRNRTAIAMAFTQCDRRTGNSQTYLRPAISGGPGAILA